MTWGEIQLLAMQKMFLNTTPITTMDISDMKTDKKYATYLNAMPETANEAIRIMLEYVPYIVTHKLTSKDACSDISNDDIYCFELDKVDSSYKNLVGVYKDVEDYEGYKIRFNKYLYLPKNLVDDESIQISYEAYPEKIKSSTSTSTVIELPTNMAALIPLYLAGELYKDDDIQLATTYMNEFEVRLAKLKVSQNTLSFVSVNGWY